MGYSCRIYIIDEVDRLFRIPMTRFERIIDRDPIEKVFEIMIYFTKQLTNTIY
jgi:hypothetical protein